MRLLLELDGRIASLANRLVRRSPAVTHIVALGARGLATIEILLMVVLGLRGRREASAKMLISVGAVYVAVEGVGLLVPRRRPFESLPNVQALAGHSSGRSFPSRHVASGLAMAYVAEEQHGLGWLMAAVAWALGTARVGAGLHFPSDVLAGAALGRIVAYAVRSIATPRGRS